FTKIELELAPRLHQRIHPGFEIAEAVAAVALCLIERDIGALEQHIRVRAISWRNRDADAGPDDDLMAGDLERGAELGQETCGYRRGISRVVDAALHDRELVGIEASHCIG